MKTFKKILVIVLLFIALVFIIALFVKKEYAIEREIVINRPKAEVFDYIKHIKNQDAYSVWNKADSDIKKTYKGTDGTTGFVYGWSGNEAGQGEQEITAITEGELISTDLRFRRPFESAAHAFMATAEAKGGTKVTWGMKGHSPYPRNFMNLFIDGIVGDDLEKGLVKMKNNLEKQ